MQDRIQMLTSHLASPSHSVPGRKSPEDVVICCALRTPLSRAKKGPLASLQQEDLLAHVLKAVLEKTKLDPKKVDDVCVGNVCPPGGGATVSRMAALYAGLPDTTSLMTVNRQCSSGLQACANIAAAIQNGTINIGIAAGVESMTNNYGAGMMPSQMSEKVLEFKPAADCMMPMGITSENVASKFGVTRKEQDEFAVASHKKAAEATAKGWFKEEIVPISVVGADGKEVLVSKDDGIRANTTFEGLSKLRPAFKEDGTTTAGNASQVTDGAAAVLLMKRSTATSLKMPILGKWISFATAGVPPEIMGIGPAFAIPKALQKASLTIPDVDIYEINEAFASQCLYSIKYLKIDEGRVNPKGGAIAIGHPLGCTGARQVATLLTELKRQGKKVGVVSMCIGTGMGAAAVIERE